MKHIININSTYELLNENRVLSSKDNTTLQNKFKTRVQGIIITDSFNNPFFPIPRPKIDTSKFDLLEVFRQYKELYGQMKSLFLPWHFCVELVEDRYFVFNTRPLDLKFPINTNEAINNQSKLNIYWDDKTKSFFKNKIFDIKEAIHICLIGNTNLDIYTTKIYNLIGSTCIMPILRQNKLPGGLYQRVFDMNLGKRFKLESISRFIKT
jgi:hypothetical protein